MLWSKISVTAVMMAALSYFLGIALIPLLRRYKTGKYQPYVGDRFKTDGSEPAFGGAVMWMVFAFGSAVAASYCSGRTGLLMSAVYTLIVTSAGAADDCLLEVRGKNCGVKTRIKLGLCFVSSLLFLLLAKKTGLAGTAVLLPFGLGIYDLGAAYCPVTAAVMTAVIYSFRVLNRFGTDEDTCIGGLAQTVCFVSMLGLSAVGTIAKRDMLTVMGAVGAAAAAGSLLWGLSPSKLRSGSSGGFFCGALMASAAVLCDIYMLAGLLLCGAAFIDAVSAVVNYAVYRSRKKLIMRGAVLHKHISMFKINDYKVIMIYSAAALAFAAAAAALAVYGEKHYF